MSRVYLLTEADLERLTLMVDRNPRHGERGGSGQVIDARDERIYSEAHRFFNYQVRTWIDEVKKP